MIHSTPKGNPLQVNKWTSAEHALDYLSKADQIPHRTEGERALIEQVPEDARRILDLGTGDGRLLSLLRIARPRAHGVGLDFSPTMLEAARRCFAGDKQVEIIEHDLDRTLPDLGRFDAIVSSFAIHHCVHERKRRLYQEIFERLQPSGVFLNLEHVASPTQALHERFLKAIDVPPGTEDPSNKLLDVETQLEWLREIGFMDADCHWKWLELALLRGARPSPEESMM
jgi:SAM-dependent methyltransferase